MRSAHLVAGITATVGLSPAVQAWALFDSGNNGYKIAERSAPEETGYAVMRLDRAAVAPAPTSPPRRRWADLFEREINNDATCGFFFYNEDPEDDSYPVTCADEDSICTNSGRFRGCCRTEKECATAVYATVCLDSTACPSGIWPTGTMCCDDSSYPYCKSNLWSTTPGDVYTFLGCHVNTTSRIGVIEAYEDGITPTPTPETSTTETSSDTSSVITSTLPPTPINDSDGDTPTGAIVGGVVGGIAVVGFAGLAIVYMLKWRKKGNGNNGVVPSNPASPNPPMAPMGQPMMYQQMGMAQQQYDPRQSYFGPTQPSPVGVGAYPGGQQSPYGNTPPQDPTKQYQAQTGYNEMPA